MPNSKRKKKKDIVDLIKFKMRVAEALIKGISTTESESDFEVFKFPVQREHTEFAWKGAITSP